MELIILKVKNQTRRKFILNISEKLATTIGVLSLGKYLAFSQGTKDGNLLSIKSPGQIKIKTNNKILVAYEGQFGSTAEVAKFIGNTLSKKGTEVDIKRINDVGNLSSYSSVIIGSAIQYDNWMPVAREFIIKNENQLAKHTVAYFFTCLTLSEKSEKANDQANGYANKLYSLSLVVKPVSVKGFAGVLDYSKMSYGARMVAKVLFLFLGVKEGDYRDWSAIRLWSEKLCF